MNELEKMMALMLEDVTTLVKITVNLTERGYQVRGRVAKDTIREMCEEFGYDAVETIAKVDRIIAESDLEEILDNIVNALPGEGERIKFDVLAAQKQMEEIKDED